MKKQPQELSERKKVFRIMPYGYILYLFVTTSVKESYEARQRSLPCVNVPDSSTYAFVWTRDGCKEIFAFLPEGCGLGATAHEMLHVVSFVMRSVGAEFEEEVWAYHLEELTQMAAEFIHKEERKKR